MSEIAIYVNFTFSNFPIAKNLISHGFPRLIGDSDGCVQYVQVCASVCVYTAIWYCHMNTQHVSHQAGALCSFLFTLRAFKLCRVNTLVTIMTVTQEDWNDWDWAGMHCCFNNMMEPKVKGKINDTCCRICVENVPPFLDKDEIWTIFLDKLLLSPWQ